MKKIENGRSMVEMLGVLAVIGILSVTGIYGYSIAMRKYRANEIVQAASILAIMAQSADSGEGECIELSKSGISNNIAGIDVEMAADPTAAPPVTVTIELKNLGDETDALCSVIENTVGDDETLYTVTCGEDTASCGE